MAGSLPLSTPLFDASAVAPPPEQPKRGKGRFLLRPLRLGDGPGFVALLAQLTEAPPLSDAQWRRRFCDMRDSGRVRGWGCCAGWLRVRSPERWMLF